MISGELTRQRIAAPPLAWARATGPSAGRVASLLLLQVLLFSPSWAAFFCGDSVFYLSRIVEPDQLRYLFTHQDIQGAYRPLNYLIHSWVLYPLFGLNPLGYHLAMLGFHLAVCVLAYHLFRTVLAREAALVALFFFGVHAVNFYTTFDASFLPDVTMMLCWLGALLCYQRFRRTNRPAWYAGSLGCFGAGLLAKETIVMLPVTLVFWELLIRVQSPKSKVQSQVENAWRLVPFFLLDALYLAWIMHIKHGLLYPGGVYSFTLRPADLARKREYLFWLLNLPSDFQRGDRLLVVAAAVVMLPAALWLLWRLARVWPQRKVQITACLLWAGAALAPVLVVTQAPMKHNLYMPLAAWSLALALALEPDASPGMGPLLRRRGWVAAAVILAVALQVRWDLRYSWVGEGARITQASLAAVQRARPTLPHGALLYVLPTTVRGNVAWYFDNGGLFRVFYGDPSLRMAFADGGQALPQDFASRQNVFIFQIHKGRLYDVTEEYKAEHSASTAYRLLERFSTGPVVSTIRWKPSELPEQGPAHLGVVARREVARQALIMLPGASVRIPVPALPPGSVLRLGVTPAGPRKTGTRGRIHFEHDGRRDLVVAVTLDSLDQRDDWWDSQVPLEPWAGRSGVFVLSTLEDAGADWLAWSRLRIKSAGAPASAASLAGARKHGPLSSRLLDAFDPQRVSMDRREPYPNYSRFDTPTGTPVFYRFVRLESVEGSAGRVALVTLAGARVEFPLAGLERASALQLSLAPALTVGDGAEARVYFEQAGQRHLLMTRRILPQQSAWQDANISLGAFTGQRGVLVLECSSGPARDTTGDWVAWARLRIENAP